MHFAPHSRALVLTLRTFLRLSSCPLPPRQGEKITTIHYFIIIIKELLLFTPPFFSPPLYVYHLTLNLPQLVTVFHVRKCFLCKLRISDLTPHTTFKLRLRLFSSGTLFRTPWYLANASCHSGCILNLYLIFLLCHCVYLFPIILSPIKGRQSSF